MVARDQVTRGVPNLMNQLVLPPRTTESLASTLAVNGRVPDSMLMQLRQRGMTCPVRGMHDPRLEYPDILIASGWERLDSNDDGYTYRYSVAEDADSHLKWEQTYQNHDDDSRTLTTICGKTQYTLEMDADGKITAKAETLP